MMDGMAREPVIGRAVLLHLNFQWFWVWEAHVLEEMVFRYPAMGGVKFKGLIEACPFLGEFYHWE